MDLKQVARQYNIEVKNVTARSRALFPRFNMHELSQYNELHYNTETYNVLNIEVPETDLRYILQAVQEWTDLLKDPETSELVMQARFLLRLRKGNV